MDANTLKGCDTLSVIESEDIIGRFRGPEMCPSQWHLTPEASDLSAFDPGDLESLSWLTTVNIPRMQQLRADRAEFGMNAQDRLHAGQLSDVGVAGGHGTSVQHLQSSMQHSPLAVHNVSYSSYNHINYNHVTYNVAAPAQDIPSRPTDPTVTSPVSQMPQFSPNFPCPTSVYQQPMTFSAQPSQQCSPGGLYSNFTTQSVYTPPQIHTPHTPHSQETQPKTYPKPIYSYSCLIAMALKNSKTGSLPVSEIYTFMKEHFPYFKTAPDGWKNSVRHNLSLNKCFEKVENKLNGSSRKGCLWALNPAKIDKMEEEMQKWKRKDLMAIRRSMANPDELDKLITVRPESCVRTPLDPQLPPLHMALPLQCLSAHQQPVLQLHSQPQLAQMSPAPAQTPPPLQPVAELVKQLPQIAPLLPEHQPELHPQQLAEIYNVHTDFSTEVDALHPSLEFSMPGTLWDELQNDSFNLDAFRSFTNSPVQMSESDLEALTTTTTTGSSTTEIPFSGVYTTYSTALDAFNNQHTTHTSKKRHNFLH
ncbi:forkhead box protein N4 [Clarias gariepinus]